MNNARGVRFKILCSVYYLQPEVVIKYLIKLESKSCSVQLLDKYFRAIFLLNIWNPPARLHSTQGHEGRVSTRTHGLSKAKV